MAGICSESQWRSHGREVLARQDSWLQYPKSCSCPRLPAEPQVPREGGGEHVAALGRPQLVAAGLGWTPNGSSSRSERQGTGPAHSAHRPGKGEMRAQTAPTSWAHCYKDHKLCGLKWQKCILEAEVQSHRADVGAVCPLPRLWRALPWPLLASGSSRRSLPCGRHTPVSASVVACPLCVSPNLPLSLVETLVAGFRVPNQPGPLNLHLHRLFTQRSCAHV